MHFLSQLTHHFLPLFLRTSQKAKIDLIFSFSSFQCHRGLWRQEENRPISKWGETTGAGAGDNQSNQYHQSDGGQKTKGHLHREPKNTHEWLTSKGCLLVGYRKCLEKFVEKKAAFFCHPRSRKELLRHEEKKVPFCQMELKTAKWSEEIKVGFFQITSKYFFTSVFFLSILVDFWRLNPDYSWIAKFNAEISWDRFRDRFRSRLDINRETKQCNPFGTQNLFHRALEKDSILILGWPFFC